MSTAHPLARLTAHGGTDYRLCIPRTDNPFPASDPAHAAWHEQWDAAALEGARILKASAAQRLYRVSLAAAALLRDMRSNPRTLTPRSQRYREVEVDLNTALSSALATTGTQQSIAGTPVDFSTREA